MHRYRNGIFFTIDNHQSTYYQIEKTLKDVYSTSARVLCNRSIRKLDITMLVNKVPSPHVIKDLMQRNRLVMLIGIHDYQDDIWQHTHGAIFGYSSQSPNLCFADESLLMSKLKRNLRRYINAGRKQRMRKEKSSVKRPTDIRPITDDRGNLHHYLTNRHNNLLDYITIRGDYSHQYPFYLLYETIDAYTIH